jgi:glutaconate CoA-transferase, subunit B
MAEPWTTRELMVACAARELRDGDVVFVGMRLPLLAFALAKATHAPGALGLFENGVVRDTAPTGTVVTMSDPANLDGALWTGPMRTVMAWLAAGRVDAGFIGGAQIDRHANLNTTRIDPGAPPAPGGSSRGPSGPGLRLPGSGGGCDIASAARRLLVIMAHEPRRFVERVDHLTSPGYGDGPGWRERVGLPPCESVTLITTRAVLRATGDSGAFQLASVHPGQTTAAVVAATPWAWPDRPRTVPETAPPTPGTLDALRRLDPERVWTADA